MDKQKISATGRRKESTVRAVIAPGSGNFTVNGKPIMEYLTRETLVNHAREALELTESINKYDVTCTARGGGIAGQAGAMRLAVARAMVELDAELRPLFRKHGLLTRDPREVERKKYGQPKARKRFQYSKR